MNAPKRSRARVLTPEGLQKLRERVRSHEADHNNGVKYSLERLGELIGLDPETVKNVRDGKKADKSSIVRCFETFGLTLAESDHIPATQVIATADPNFVGRDEAISDLNTLVSRNAKVIVIQARGGVGKTTLARKYLQQEFGSFLEFPIAKETKDIASIEGLLEEKLRQLGEEPGREFLVSLDRLKRKLQAERLGILIDNLEPALDSAGKFIEAHRRYVELLRVLSDPIVQSITLITSRERLREADVTVQHYPLRSLDATAWSQFFQSRGIDTETSALTALHNSYGGNAKAMDIISGAVLEDFSSDVEAYWQANQDDLFIERDLEDLVARQFDRLQQLDPDAYKLLCRMGCYRYQDIPTVPIEGLLCLLWDVPENRHRRVIKALQDRSLADCEDREFWLHPVIRAEALSCLKSTEDWEITNRKIAEFWTNSIQIIERVKDAVQALEAYYHYININNIDEAANVILKRRTKRRNRNSTLGYSCYRLGLLNQILNLINPIITCLKISYKLSELYFLAGDLKSKTGNLNEAIFYNAEARKIAEIYPDIAAKKLEEKAFPDLDIRIGSLFNEALYRFWMWELDEARITFLKVVDLSGKADDRRCLVGSLCYLALLSAYRGYQEEAYALERRANKSLNKKPDEVDETFNFISWSKGYGPLVLGEMYRKLGNTQRAFSMYQASMEYAQEINHTLIKANSLSGYAEVYREKKEFENSLSLHIEAIEILENIGAKTDLAESYYRLGLTYQEMGETEKGFKSFQEAIRLFANMEAPKQVERVRKSMQNLQQ